MLVVSGERQNRSQGGGQQQEVLYRGIAGRGFEHRFELADHVKVVGAYLADGLLTIDLQREVPEAMRPRRIQIGKGNPAQGPRRIDEQQAA